MKILAHPPPRQTLGEDVPFDQGDEEQQAIFSSVMQGSAFSPQPVASPSLLEENAALKDEVLQLLCDRFEVACAAATPKLNWDGEVRPILQTYGAEQLCQLLAANEDGFFGIVYRRPRSALPPSGLAERPEHDVLHSTECHRR